MSRSKRTALAMDRGGVSVQIYNGARPDSTYPNTAAVPTARGHVVWAHSASAGGGVTGRCQPQHSTRSRPIQCSIICSEVRS